MKKMFFILSCGILSFMFFTSCNQEKALDQMLSKQEVAEMILTRMWDKPEMRAKIQETVMKDQESVNKILDGMLQDSTAWAPLMDKLGSNESFKIKLIAQAKDWEKAAKTKKK